MAVRFVYKHCIGRKNRVSAYFAKNGFPSLTQCRTILSEAYACRHEWENRLNHPLLKDLKIGLLFSEIDKKFQSKRLVSGAHIDMFANAVRDDSHIGELEHLLYRFRRTKRTVETLDSTCHATVKLCLKFKSYDALLRMLEDRQNYGLFPDFYSYNALMDEFLELERYRDAAGIAVLMMLQEDLSNPVSRLLGLKSCQAYLDQGSFDSWERVMQQEEDDEGETEKTEEDEDQDEETMVRVPYLRNPWFDDHFEIQDPKLLVGKTLYLIGREEHNVLGRTYQLLGLAMYEKWDRVANFLDGLVSTNDSSLLLDDGVQKFKDLAAAIQDEGTRDKLKPVLEEKLQKLVESGKILSGTLSDALDTALKRIPELELADIQAQKELFLEWERLRAERHQLEVNAEEKDRRLQVIANKKEELYWEEKFLFYYENERDIKQELVEIDEILAKHAAKASDEDKYIPPVVLKKKEPKLSTLRKKAMVKRL